MSKTSPEASGGISKSDSSLPYLEPTRSTRHSVKEQSKSTVTCRLVLVAEKMVVRTISLSGATFCGEIGEIDLCQKGVTEFLLDISEFSRTVLIS